MPQNFTLVGTDPTIIVEENETKYALTEMGLQEEDFLIAGREAIRARDSVSPLAALNQAGNTLRSSLLENLRLQLLSRKFEAQYLDGYDLIIHPARLFAMAVTRGNDNTGSDEEPRTHAKKGPNTLAAVKQNRGQLNLFEALGLPKVVFVPTAPQASAIVDGMPLWLVLYHRNVEAELLEIELSLPSAIDGELKPSGWHKRIPMRPVPFGSAVSVSRNDASTYNEEGIEIGVERRPHGS